MKAELFHKIIGQAKEDDVKVTIVFNGISSCGGYSSTSTHLTARATDIYEWDDYFDVHIKDALLLDVLHRDGTVFSEYENVKLIIVDD